MKNETVGLNMSNIVITDIICAMIDTKLETINTVFLKTENTFVLITNNDGTFGMITKKEFSRIVSAYH